MTLLLLGGALAAAPDVSTHVSASADVSLDVSLPFREETLANGVRVVLSEDRRAPRVVVHVLVEAGAAEDPPGRRGLAHLVEHLLYEGSPAAPDGTYDRLVAAAGGADNAWTDHDHTALWATWPAGNEDLALALEADRLRGLAAEEEAVRNQRDVIARERQGMVAGGERATIARMLWPEAHPYAVRPIGRAGDVEAATLADARAFHARHFRPDRVVVTVVGDFDADAVMTLARARLGAVEAREGGDTSADTSDPGPLSEPVRAWTTDDVDRPAVHLAWRTVPWDHPDRPALQVAADVLLRDGRLYRALGERAQPAAVAWSGERGGSFVLSATTRGRARRALRALEAAVARLAEEGPHPALLAAANTRFRADQVRALQSLEARAQVLALCVSRAGTPDCLDAELAAREAVTPEAVRAAVSRWLAPEAGLTLAVVPASKPRAPRRGMDRVEIGE